MEKYRVLLAGKGKAVIDDLFKHADGKFDMVSTSLRYDDMNNHLKYFEPDIFIYCTANDTKEDLSKLVGLQTEMKRKNTVFVLIGAQDDCNFFQRTVIHMTDIVLIKPISSEKIQSKIISYMRENKRKAESEKAMETDFTDLLSANKKQSDQSKDGKDKTPTELAVEDILAGLELELNMETEVKPKEKKHVLIIDDDPSVLRLIKEHLRENYHVATAINSKIAYKYLTEKKTDLILLDYEMPGEKGPQVLENLRKNHLLKDIPVIFLTGIAEREKIEEALKLKPQGYLLKPIDREKLLEIIKKHIG